MQETGEFTCEPCSASTADTASEEGGGEAGGGGEERRRWELSNDLL